MINNNNLSNLKILQINIRSILNKKDILEEYLDRNNIDIALISETWLKPNSIINFKNYNIFCKHRRDGYGGVAILAQKYLLYKDFKTENYTPIETVEVTFSLIKKQVKFISMYVPPNACLRKLKEQVKKLIDECEGDKKVIIGGDINAHDCLWERNSVNDKKGKVWANAILNSGLVVLNNGDHTYQNLSRNYTSAVDVTLMSTELSQNTEWKICENLTSDHFAIRFDIFNEKVTDDQNTRFVNQNKIISELSHFNFETLKDIDYLENALKDNIKSNTIHIPTNNNYKPKPWWNDHIKKLWLVKNQKQTLYNQTRSLYTAIQLRKSNNKLKTEIRKAKKESWESFLESIKPSASSMDIWSKVNCIRNKKQNFNGLDSQLKISAFMNHNFISSKNLNLKDPLILPSFDLFTPEKIEELIKKAKNSSAGSDGISYKILKSLPKTYFEVIAKHFNTIWKTHSFPIEWKNIKVVGIPKPHKDKNKIENFRPISLLPVHLKIFNRVLKLEIEKHLNKNKILPEFSFGFRKDMSTTDYFVQLLSKIEKNRKEKKAQILISLDFSRAFDCVDRNKMISILKELELEENICLWVDKFLSNRRVTCSNVKGKHTIITSEGLPQGSCLSPILFNMYTLSLHSSNSEDCQVFQFADDFVLLISTKLKHKIEQKTKEILTNFVKNAHELNLQLNIDKSKLLNLYKRKNKIKEIRINDKTISSEMSVKVLGVLFDENLNFTKHHTQLRNNLKNDLNLIKILSSFYGGINPKISIQLYNSLIKTKIDYSSVITAMSPKTNTIMLQKAKNVALRTALGLTKTTPILTIMDLAATSTMEFEIEYNVVKYLTKKLYIDPNFREFVLGIDCATYLRNLYINHNILKKCPNLIKDTEKPLNLSIFYTENHENKEISRHLANENIANFSDFYQIYTDASIGEESSNRGVGIYYYTSKEEMSVCVEETISIKSAETIGILIGLQEAVKSQQQKICIFSDSMSSLVSIENCLKNSNHRKYFENLIITIAIENPEKEFVLCWVPSHVGIKGNEKADQIAKNAVHFGNKLSLNIEPKEIIYIIKNNIWKNWTDEYVMNTANVGSHLAIINKGVPSKKPWFSKSKMPAKDIKLINRLKAGHTYNKKVLYKMKKIESQLCEHCNVIEDTHHILFACKNFNVIRNNYKKLCQEPDTIKLMNTNVDENLMEICKYIKEINVTL